MKILTFTICLLLCQWAHGQILADFENYNIGVDSALIDAGEAGVFESGEITLKNNFFESEFGDYFTDWAISSMTDTLTEGNSNSTSAFAGSGHQSDTYAVASAFNPVKIGLNQNTSASGFSSLYLTNSTYTALSMLNGDAFAKRFGGETGEDPDFLKLTIKTILDGVISSDSIDFYLADYRFEDHSLDYVVKDWTFVDISALGQADSLVFSLSSSDVGAFGMNTPAFFCMDDVAVQMQSATFDAERPDAIDLKIYPNPARDQITLKTDVKTIRNIQILDQGGKIVSEINGEQQQINIDRLKAGVYYLQVISAQGVAIQKLIKL
ncbi:T9SS type A sorting domain-containing protein [Portibacter marinus]|uniref:T9SS type A sorting domain-containing protein n=1 Tax=Portibacter marinus TaxID=2898660 RepID=UPI001F34D985|nr:DUF4465 domain-containing protein [Portibacter marinus]